MDEGSGTQSDQVQREGPGEFEACRSLSRGVLLDRHAIGVERLDPRIFELPSEELDRAWPTELGVGKWPIRVLVGHLADAEMTLVHRMRRVVAEPGCELHLWDEDAFIDAGLYGVIPAKEGGEASSPPIGAAVAVIHTLRQWTGLWLRSLPAEAWTRSGMHVETGPMSLRDVLAYDVWHLEHHAWFCHKKVQRALGEV